MILYILLFGLLLVNKAQKSEASLDGRASLYNPWSDWSTWGSCSRNCGIGIKSRTRFCRKRNTFGSKSGDTLLARNYYRLRRKARSIQDIFNFNYKVIPVEDGRDGSAIFRLTDDTERVPAACYGDSVEIKLCNTQACPRGSLDFIDFQCSQYDNREIAKHFVAHWVALEGHYAARRNPCELRCRSEDSTIMYSFGKMADGTVCSTEKQSVCVNGRCLRVGCDGVVGSKAANDMCLVCGGRNTTCVQVQQMYSSPLERINDYTSVTVIPKGATNIHIQEHSRNILALKEDSTGVVVLNGNFTPQPSGGVWAGGTKFSYVRNRDHKETISASGPIYRSVSVMLLQVDRASPKVWYDYWIPKESHKSTNPVTDDSADGSSERKPSVSLPRSHSNPVAPTVGEAHRPVDILPQTTSSSTTTATSTASLPERRKYKKKKHKRNKNRTSKNNNQADLCPVCQHVKNQVEHFCSSHMVLRVLTLRSEVYEGYLRYEVDVKESYKKKLSTGHKEFIFLPDKSCPCPKLEIMREYIIMAHHRSFNKKEVYLMIDKDSFVRRFTEKRGRQLHRLRRLQNKKCNRTSLALN